MRFGRVSRNGGRSIHRFHYNIWTYIFVDIVFRNSTLNELDDSLQYPTLVCGGSFQWTIEEVLVDLILHILFQ